MPQKHISLDNCTFTQLTVLCLSKKKNSHGTRLWECICTCGNIKYALGHDLLRGMAKSCGCRNAQITKKRNFKHGLIKEPEYDAWSAMKNRCYSLRAKAFKNYGGRGISVSAEWYHSFEQFYADMGPRPSPLHSLDRYPDNNGDYKKGNCRWATKSEQRKNQRSNRGPQQTRNKFGYKGVRKCYNRWAAYITKHNKQIYLGSFITPEEAHAAYCEAADILDAS